MSKSQVFRLCAEIDGRVTASIGRWKAIGAIFASTQTYLQIRQNARIVPVAVIVAMGVNTRGRREVLGGTSARPRPSRSRSRSCLMRG